MKNKIEAPLFAQSFNICDDYVLLWKLVFNKGLRVPCWIIYSDKYDDPIWDLVEVKKQYMSENRYSLGSRGIGYESIQNLEGFVSLCESLNLYFIQP